MIIPKEIQTSLIMDIFDTAYRIEELLNEYTKDYEPGFYLRNQSEPIIPLNKGYFCYKEGPYGAIRNTIRGIEDITNIVYNEYHQEIFHVNNHKRINEILFTKPTLPFKGMTFIKEHVYAFVYNLVKWGNFPIIKMHDLLHKAIGPEFLIKVNESTGFYGDDGINVINMADEINSILVDLNADIINFMNKDYHHRYDVTYKGMHLCITKLQDYRIYEYEKLKQLMDSNAQ